MLSRFSRLVSMIVSQGDQGSRSTVMVCNVEPLESRQLLSTIAWDGGASGNGTNMLDPLNWAGDVLPAAGDDITIGATGTSPGLTLGGVFSARNLTSSRAIQINAGGNLSITAADQSAALTMNLGTLTGGVWNMSAQFTMLNAGGASTLAGPDIRGIVVFAPGARAILGLGTRFTQLQAPSSTLSIITVAANYVLQDPVRIDGFVRFEANSTAMTITATGSVIGAGICNFSGILLTNNGTLTTTGTGNYQFDGDVLNYGTITVASGFIWNVGAIFRNYGTMNLAGASGVDFRGTSWINSGTINLQTNMRIRSNINTADLNSAGIHNTTGAVLFEGIVNNANATLQITSQMGNVFLSGGEIRGGILTCDAGTQLRFSSGNPTMSTLRDVQVTNPLTLDENPNRRTALKLAGTTTFPSMQVTWGALTLDHYTLNAPVEFAGLNSTSEIIIVDGDNVSAIGPNAIVRLAPGAVGDLSITNNGNAIATVMAGRLQQDSARTLAFVGNWISTGEIRVTAGNFRADNAQGVSGFVNQGVVNILTGGTATIANSYWANPGLINVTSATLVLAGTLRSGDFNFAGLVTSNAIVNVTGTVDNAGAAFPINAVTSTWRFVNNAIVGGAINVEAGFTFGIVAGNRLTLTDVQVNGEIQCSGNLFLGGNTRFARANLLGNSRITLISGYSIRDEILVSGTGIGRQIYAESAGGVIASTGVIHIDATATGQVSIIGGTNLYLLNRGTVISDSAADVQIGGPTFINYGVLRVNSGGRLMVSSTNFSNPGTIEISGGTLELAGTTIGADFNGPGVTNTGGAFAISGTINNSGSSLSLPNVGSITLLPNSVINGGTIALAPGAAAVIAAPTSNVSLNGVTFQTDIIVNIGNVYFTGASRFTSLRLRGASTANFPAGFTLRDNIIAEGVATGPRNVVFPSTAAATIAAGVTVELAADAAGDLVVTGGSSAAVPFANLGTFHAVSPTNRLRILGPAFTSSGALQVDGGSMSVESTVWSSSGQINANGGTLAVIGTWTSFGSINLQNASTTLGGSFTTAGLHLASFARSRGTLAISAIWANNAQTVDLATTLGSIILIGAHISGGTLISSPTGTITIVGSGAELNGVQISGDLVATNTAALTVRGTTRFGTLFLRGVSSVTFDTIFTLQDRVVADGTAVGLRSIFIPNSGSLTISPTGSIALASNSGGDLSVRPGTGTTTLVNNGQIIAGGNTALTVSTTNFTNNALMSVSSGRLAFTTGTMTSLGQFVVSGGTLSLGGTFNTTGFDSSQMTRTGGTVELAGTLANTGRTLTLNGGTGSWVLNAATVSSGQIILNNGVTLNATTGTTVFQGTTIQGDIIAFSGAVISMQPATRFTILRLHGTAIVDLLTGFTLFDAITAEGPETGTRTLRMLGATSGTIGATGSIRLAADSGGDLAYSPSSGIVLSNAGLISNDSATRALTLRVNPLTNTGTIQAVGGAIQITGAVSNIAAGVLTGGTWRIADGGSIAGLAAITANAATIILDGSDAGFTAIGGLLSNTGTISLGGVRDATFAPAGGTFTQSGTLSLDAGSHLHITGAFVQTGTGQLLIRVAGTSANQIGSVTASGAVTLDGGLTITFTPGYTPVKLDGFDVVLGSAVSGTFSSVVLPPPLPVGKNFILYNSGSIRFVVSSLADTNSDGLVDFFDYLDFVSAFSINDPSADFNGDGGIDLFDYLDFIDEFSQF